MATTRQTGNASDNSSTVIDLYVRSEKIYPREVRGLFSRLRVITVWVLLGLYYLLPWLSIDGQPLVLFDLPARKFYIFGLVFWPQDFILLTGLLVLAALSLFFFTALAGRLWCGYACPQTVWTEVFIWLERLAEGPASKRKKRDRGGWTGEKIRRKIVKHGLWLIFALWTGFTFVGFFTPITELAEKIVQLNTGGWETFWVLFYSFATWGNAGVLREQVCKYMCPYARFQSAMFDDDTLVISYDQERGEPRGSRSRKLAHAQLADNQLGDCIDCTLCVQVCPTGIDIREGLQYECIACAACIDVCDDVMQRMQYPTGLIRYTTQNAMDNRASRIIRPRILLYAALLLAVLTAWVIGVSQRDPVMLDVMRDRNALFRELPDGRVENSFLLRVMNRTGQQQQFSITAGGLPGLEIYGTAELQLEPGEIGSLPVTLRAASEGLKLRNDITFTAQSTDTPELIVEEPSRFFGPRRNLR